MKAGMADDMLPDHSTSGGAGHRPSCTYRAYPVGGRPGSKLHAAGMSVQFMCCEEMGVAAQQLDV